MKKYSVIIFIFLCSCVFNSVALATPDSAIPDSLVKASQPAVYYYAQDGKRYVFPNHNTYETWFSGFSSVTTISDAELATMPLGGNVTYRPGVKMVKIQTDPKVYVVGQGGVLRWVTTEALAIQLYGENWNEKIDDVPDTFFINYTVGEPIYSLDDYSPAVETLGTRTINKDKGIAVGESPLKSDTITLAPIAITIIDITPDEVLGSVTNSITINGAKFMPGARVFIDNTEANQVSFINESTLKIEIIEGVLLPGTHSVRVLNPNGTTTILQDALTVSLPTPVLPELSLIEIFNKVAPSVVRIYSDEGQGCPCTGSGIVIDREGYILTNYHVIEGDNDVEIRLYDGRTLMGDVLGWSELRDLAVIKIKNTSNFVDFGDYDAVTHGDAAFTLGYPLGVASAKISQGMILSRNQIINGAIYLLTDADIDHGSSGGPLVNGRGEVIGVVRGGLVIPGTETFYGYNFAIPIDIAEALLPDLKAGVRTLKN